MQHCKAWRLPRPPGQNRFPAAAKGSEWKSCSGLSSGSESASSISTCTGQQRTDKHISIQQSAVIDVRRICVISHNLSVLKLRLFWLLQMLSLQHVLPCLLDMLAQKQPTALTACLQPHPTAYITVLAAATAMQKLGRPYPYLLEACHVGQGMHLGGKAGDVGHAASIEARVVVAQVNLQRQACVDAQLCWY